MNPLSFIALLPVIEIVLLIGMGALFGFWFTLAWVIGTAVLGIVILRRLRGKFQMTGALDPGIQSSNDALGVFAMWIGAVLLILPGPLTDLLGFILVLPWLRRLTFGLWIAKNLHTVVQRRTGRGRVYEGEVVDVTESHKVIRRIPEDDDQRK